MNTTEFKAALFDGVLELDERTRSRVLNMFNFYPPDDAYAHYWIWIEGEMMDGYGGNVYVETPIDLRQVKSVVFETKETGLNITLENDIGKTNKNYNFWFEEGGK